MNWFFIALLTPLLHSIANFTDKFILSKYFQKYRLSALVLYSSLIALIFLPFLFLVDHHVLGISLKSLLCLILAGIFSMAGIYCYLYALNKDDASAVIPLFQLIPVMSYVLGLLILKESLSHGQMFGALVIIAGAIILSVEIEDGKKIRLKHHVALAAFVGSLLLAGEGILFKFAAVPEKFWVSNFWEYVGFVLFGLSIFLLNKIARSDFVKSFKEHKAKVIAGIFFAESFTLGGYLSLNFAFLLAPVVLVRVVESYQPIFVFVFGALLTYFFPSIIKEKMHWKHLVQKIAAILVILLGSYYLLS